jgi:glycosyltransferase involved in cell wall biosynthesis
LYVGRLSAEKGVSVLIEAMRHLPGLSLKLLGEGPDRASLEEQVVASGLDNVDCCGYVTGEEKWQIMRQATATVLPSLWYENFPFAVLESLAVGTPVIASRLGSLPHVVCDGETGLLFEPGDPCDLVSKVRCLVDSDSVAQEMRLRARRYVEQQGTSETHYAKLLAIYDDVIEGKGGQK